MWWRDRFVAVLPSAARALDHVPIQPAIVAPYCAASFVCVCARARERVAFNYVQSRVVVFTRTSSATSFATNEASSDRHEKPNLANLGQINPSLILCSPAHHLSQKIRDTVG